MSDLLSIYNELQSKKWVDLTHKINAESPHFPALPALKQEDLLVSMFKNLQWLVNTERILMHRFTL